MKKYLMPLKAFTLIELLVVISIIGILAALLLANFAGIRDRADDAKNKNNLKQIQTALRLSYNDTQSYPGTAGGSCNIAAVTANLNSSDIPSTCVYEQLTSDTFRACITLSNTADNESLSSQTRCGITGASQVAGRYCVCSN
jgi:prepilin-type N-terminal cleavage/methylation domain-containing protein